MILIIAILVAAGCAMIGHVVGLAAFAGLFELLRPYDLDEVLDSPARLENFRWAFAIGGAVVGFWLILRWRSMDLLVRRRLPTVRTLLLATLAGAGGAMITHVADVGTLSIKYLKTNPENHIVVMLASALIALLLGAAISFGFGRGYRPLLRFLGGTALASLFAFALIVGYLVFDKGIFQSHRKLGEPKTVLMDIRFPANVSEFDRSTVRIALRSGGQTSPGTTHFWHRQDGRLTLRASVELRERTRDRTIVFSRDGELDRVFRLTGPANPQMSHDFGPWQPFSAVDIPADQPTATIENADYQIRYLIR